MKTSEILELVRAGFSRAEIMAMDTENPPAETQPEEIRPAAPADQPAEPAAPSPVETQTPDWQQQLFTQLGALTAAIQGQNRAQAEMGAQIIEPYAAGVNTLRGLVNIPNKEDK